MISRHFRIVFVLMAAAAAALTSAACQKVPLLAPSGSAITLTASNTAVPVNGTVQLSAQLLEASGTPPHSGTLVTFTTTLGTIEPASAETDVNGRAVATFKAGNTNGSATITASSGGATANGTNAVKIAVGSAAVGHVSVNASPTLIPALGGSSAITATVLDINGNPLPTALVSFSTTAGSLSTTVGTTDANGIASTTLQTSTTATVADCPSSPRSPSRAGTTRPSRCWPPSPASPVGPSTTSTRARWPPSVGAPRWPSCPAAST